MGGCPRRLPQDYSRGLHDICAGLLCTEPEHRSTAQDVLLSPNIQRTQKHPESTAQQVVVPTGPSEVMELLASSRPLACAFSSAECERFVSQMITPRNDGRGTKIYSTSSLSHPRRRNLVHQTRCMPISAEAK